MSRNQQAQIINLEAAAGKWLKKQGYTKIKYFSTSSPDYLVGDIPNLLGFEVKTIFEHSIYIPPQQYEIFRLSRIPINILAMSSLEQEPIAVIPFTDILNGLRHRNGITIRTEPLERCFHIIKLTAEEKAKLNIAAKKQNLLPSAFLRKTVMDAID